MLSRTAEYALRAVVHLASRRESWGEDDDGEGPVSAGSVAEALDLPENYLSKLLHRLQQEGVLESRRGPRGGFWLARDPADVSLTEVVRPFDDLVEGRRCLLGRSECRDESPCAAHGDWKELAEEVRRFFATTSVARLAAREPGPVPSGDESGPRPSPTDGTSAPRGP